ncbi:hypothetical protein SAMN05421837_109280 [Amycolatopsis pretoriensis]|uniref:Uncharacterized protein n=1 Tax=Amycolatopsis pretoriensis TaxID=218821 RepID=A0A1H5RCN1_9PSEU|nr:hypothetical protein [Amycolatopsis pretoriensis]SEF36123.1 hypothetical protein SAMN05421837_109280 [Amycolatopsis pretoriensis]
MLRALFTTVLAAAVATSTALPAAAAPAPAVPGTSSAPTTPAERTALDTAVATGRPVVLPDQTTETREVLVNPDGTFTMRSSAAPQRVRRDGRWIPVDTSLRTNPDGSLAPAATLTDLRLSGGGTGPVITLAEPGGKVAFTWPAPLPKPAVTANKATYAGVFPGVDLVVSADATGYSYVLVVHDAEAAANPALRAIKLRATTEGVALDAKDGALTARDTRGARVFSGSTPVMWDSTHQDQSSPAPSESVPGKVTQLGLTATAAGAKTTDLTVAPDSRALTGNDVHYPVYIDPGMSGQQQAWGEVTANGYHYFNAAMDAQVGRCWNGDGQCGSLTVARSYFRLDTGPLQKRNGFTAVVFSAEMWFTQVWGAHKCVAEPVTLYSASYFDGGLAWGNQPLGSALDTESSGAGIQCSGAAGVRFANQAVKDYAQASANNNWPNVHLALLAADEGNTLQWKKFGSGGSVAPHFDVTFSFQPSDATNQHVSRAVTCTGLAITPDARPTLYGTAVDNNNPPLTVTLNYEVWDSAGSVRKAAGEATVASGTQAAWTIPAALGDGDYKYRITVHNNFPGDGSRNLWSPGWSPWYAFRIQATPPPAAPALTSSVDYPANYWGAPRGAAGAVAVNSGGSPNISGYTYTFAGSGTEPVPNTGSCDYTPTGAVDGGWAPASASGPTWLPIPAGLTAGYHTLNVRSFDDAHNLSPETAAHVFYVAPNTGQTTRRYEAESLVASQPAGQTQPLVTQEDSNCCVTTWSGHKQLFFQGNAAGQAFSIAFDVTTEADYQLDVGLTKAADYGQVAFKLDGQAVGRPDIDQPVGSIDAYSPKVINALTPLGITHLATGTHTFTVTVTGTNARSIGQRYLAGLDHLTITRTTRYEAELPAQVTPGQPAGQNVPLTVETQTAANGGPWSQGAQLLFAAGDKDKSFDLAFTVPVEADYALGIAMGKRENRGKVRIAVDGTALMRTDTVPWDGYQAANGRTVQLALGGAHLGQGRHKLTITVVGKNDASSGYAAGVDYLTAVPVNSVTSASFTDAMNNRGYATDNTTAADLDFNGSALSTNTLAAAGLRPGTKVTIGRATFTMPAANAATGNDNVVAMGQKIPLPAVDRVKATAIGLLATSTCGDTAPSTMTVTYTDGTTSDPVVPTVPDWVNGPDRSAAITLSHLNNGATPGAAEVKLYMVLAPADPTKTIASVTLPNTGTGFLTNTCGPAPSMHVLAIAPAPVAAGWLGAWSSPPTVTTDVSTPTGTTLRMVVHPTKTGPNMRIRLSNSQSGVPATVPRTTVAAQSGTVATTLSAPVPLKFNGAESVTIPAGGEVWSDPMPFPSTAGGSGNLLVSVAIPANAPPAADNDDADSVAYRAPGDATGNSDGGPFGSDDLGPLYGHSFFAAGVEVSTTDANEGTVVVLSDTGYGYRTRYPDWSPIWTDFIAETLGSKLPGSITHGGYPSPGTAAASRERYVFDEPNVRTVIVNMGYLDEDDTLTTVRQKLTNLMSASSPVGLRKFSRADGTPLSIVLTTIPPRGGDPTDAQETLRRQVNDEIRANYTNLGADNFIDFDAAVRDPAAPNKAQAALLNDEGVPNEAYDRRLAQAVSDAVDGFPSLTL